MNPVTSILKTCLFSWAKNILIYPDCISTGLFKEQIINFWHAMANYILKDGRLLKIIIKLYTFQFLIYYCMDHQYQDSGSLYGRRIIIEMLNVWLQSPLVWPALQCTTTPRWWVTCSWIQPTVEAVLSARSRVSKTSGRWDALI